MRTCSRSIAQTAGPNSGISATTHYTYDNLNRLMAAMVPSHYTQAYNYDRYGNMACASGSYACNTGITFAAPTNWINTTGYSYDAAGDLTRDGSGTGTHSFEWDAEQRMKTVDAGSNGTFVYNAMGQRVQKNIGGTSYYYLHDAFGNVSVVRSASSLLEKIIPGANAKYYQNGAGWKTDYLRGNPLGTTQIVTQADTSVEEERIFYPFGILRWQSGGSQDVRFAGMQERDSETVSWQDSLDWTPNRTFGENMGRWFSPDPAVAGQVPLGGDITNPESLNRYAYVMNSPTNFVDPLGLWTHPISCIFLGCADNPRTYCATYYCGYGGITGFGWGNSGYDPFDLAFTEVCYPEGGCNGYLDPGGAQFYLASLLSYFGPIAEPVAGSGGPVDVCSDALKTAGQNKQAITRALNSWDTLSAASKANAIDPALLGAIGVRESGFLNVHEADGAGVGTGVFQITVSPTSGVTAAQASNFSWAANYAASMLHTNTTYLSQKFPAFTSAQLLQATAAAYNFGVGNISGNPSTIDVGTTGGNYGSNVVNLMNCF